MVVTVFSALGDAQDTGKFLEAVATGDLNAVQQAFKARVDPNVREPNGSTPLIIAAMFGQTSVVSFLIENGARLNIQNNQGSTALHFISKIPVPMAPFYAARNHLIFHLPPPIFDKGKFVGGGHGNT